MYATEPTKNKAFLKELLEQALSLTTYDKDDLKALYEIALQRDVDVSDLALAFQHSSRNVSVGLNLSLPVVNPEDLEQLLAESKIVDSIIQRNPELREAVLF